MPQPKAKQAPKASKPAKVKVGDLTADQSDAILRDVNVPGDVRTLVANNYAAQRYLDAVKFHKDSDGVTHVKPSEG